MYRRFCVYSSSRRCARQAPLESSKCSLKTTTTTVGVKRASGTSVIWVAGRLATALCDRAAGHVAARLLRGGLEVSAEDADSR